MKTTQGLRIFSSLVFVTCASLSQAAVINWNNVGGGNYSDGANWSGGVAPGNTDEALFDSSASSSYTTTFTEDADAQSLSVNNDNVTIELNGHNLETTSGISVGGAEGGRLTLRGGKYNQKADDSGDLIKVLVGSEAGSKGDLVLDGVEFGNPEIYGRMQYYIGQSQSGFGGGEGTLELKNGSQALGQTAFIGDKGKVLISGGSGLSLANELIMESGGYLKISEGTGVSSSGASLAGKVLVDGEHSSLNVGEYGHMDGDITYQNGATGSGGNIAVGNRMTIDGAGSDFSAMGNVDVNGRLTVSHGASLSSDYAISALPSGVLSLNDGKVSAEAVLTEGGKIEGSGEIKGNVSNTNRGTVATGENGDALTITGNFSQDSSSTLALTLGGWDAIGDYKLNISGDANLEGILKIDLWDTFKPELNDVFTLIKAENINGMFSDFVLPSLASGLAWDWGSVMVAGLETFSLKVVKSVPEPYTIVLMTIGLAGFAGARRFRKAA
ncbi:PEP-CTERM sorting domain-containing protein [Hahella sp. NBU794]|uniref:PEP-CTERM sorting domain-containing protein n=1 Tax=Hahella sp. NBU794 TaxID=3422590 RepID=UPI003D6E2952